MKLAIAALVSAAILSLSSIAAAEESTKTVSLSVGDVTQQTLICYSGKTCAIGIIGDSKLAASFTVNGIEVETQSMGAGNSYLMITNKDKLPKVMLLLVTNPTARTLQAELRSGSW